MKRVLKPAEQETVIYYSDFSGTVLGDTSPIEIRISANYGSKYDELDVEIHLSDLDFDKLLEFLKQNFTEESLAEFKKEVCL